MQNKLLFGGMILVLVGLAIVQLSLYFKTATPPENSQDVALDGVIETDDKALQAAFEKARKQLDYFLGVAEKQPDGTQNHSLKVAIQDGDSTELFWVYPFEETADGFSGRINDEPKQVDNVFKGQVIEFKRGQIVDWTFDDTETERMHGNFTGCVELRREAPDHADKLMELYGMECN